MVKAGLRVNYILFINLIPVLINKYLNFLSDILFLNISCIRQIYRAIGLIIYT